MTNPEDHFNSGAAFSGQNRPAVWEPCGYFIDQYIEDDVRVTIHEGSGFDNQHSHSVGLDSCFGQLFIDCARPTLVTDP